MLPHLQQIRYLNSSRLVTALIFILLFSDCNKPNVVDTTEDKGQTLVKIIGGGTPANIVRKNIDFDNKPVTILAADIRRDVANATELNKTMTVVVKQDSAIVSATNPAYKILPESFYSVGPETPKSGGHYTITLRPGEFAKEILITIQNPMLLNSVSKYALGFTISTVNAGGKISVQNSIVVEIVTINNWDGVYLNIGNPAASDHGFRDVTNSGFTWLADQEYALITIDNNKCAVINNGLNSPYLIPGFIFSNNGFPTYYGSYGLVVSFNPATNSIDEVYNFYGDLTLSWLMPSNYDPDPSCTTGPPLYASCNSRRAVLDPSGVNAVQANRDIIIKHFMLQPSVIPSPPSIRCYFDETWQYLRPR